MITIHKHLCINLAGDLRENTIHNREYAMLRDITHSALYDLQWAIQDQAEEEYQWNQ